MSDLIYGKQIDWLFNLGAYIYTRQAFEGLTDILFIYIK